MSRVLFLFFILLIGATEIHSQCTVYDGQGNVSGNPVWVSCSGGTYTLYIQSPNNFGALTINWGDGSANTSVASLVSPAFISHTYAANIANYTVTITETNGCSITGLVVMEEPVNASIQIPIGGVTQTCAPDVLIFTNSSTDVSSNTTFVWDFGDGSPVETYGDTNAGQTISHTYQQGTVDCVTEVTLEAENYCSFGNPTTASFNPIQIYDIDEAIITADFQLLCYPDTIVHFDNTTDKNCVPQGNTAQRFEYWNFGNYWGTGSDSIIDWTPFDPPAKPGYDIAFPGIGTYIIMMADSNQCGADTTIITIQITDPPIADFSMSADSNCQGEVVNFTRLSTLATAHLIDFGDGGGFQGFGATASHMYNTPGNFTVTVVANVGGGSPSCTDTTSLPLVILPSPTAIASINPNGGCDSVTSVFINTSSGGASYLWYFGGGDTSILQNPPPISFTTAGEHVVTLTVTSNNGCVDSTTASVDVYDTPVASFGALNVCEDELATFLDSSTVGYGGPINSWSWNFGDALNSTSSLQNPTFTYLDSGTFTILLIASTSFCSDSVFSTITVEPRPIAAFQESDSIGCSPLTVSFTNQSSFGNSYLWDFGDGNTSNQASPNYTFVHTGLTDTFFIVQLAVFSAFGCVDSITDTIEVLGNPVAGFSSNAVLDCAPLEVQFLDSSLGAIAYSWDFDDGFGSTGQDPSHIFQNQTQFISNYVVTLTVTASNGCTDSAMQSVTVYPEPLFGFSIVPDSGCSPLTVQFPVAVGAVLYSWDFGDNTTSTGPNPSHTYVNNTTNAATYNVTLIATSPFGCVDTVTGSVKVFPKPNADLTPSFSAGCGPLDVSFINGSTGGTTYDWDFDDGTTLASSSASLAHEFGNTLIDTAFYNPILIATTDEGCKDTSTVEVHVYRRVVAEFSVNDVGCHPFSATFTDNSSNAISWDWDFDDGFFSSQQNPQHVFQNTGVTPIQRDVVLNVESLEGCTDDTTIQVTINPKPQANFNIDDSPACDDEEVTIENLSSENEINTWRFFNSGIPTIINDQTIDTAFNNPGSGPLEFRIFLIVENAFGCTDSIDKGMIVFPAVKAEFIALDEGCSPFDVDFTNLSSGSNLFSWEFGDGDISFEDEPSHTFETSGVDDETFKVTLLTTSPYGCEDRDSFDILVHPTPEPVFTANPFTQRYPDTTVTFNNLTAAGPWIYEWDFGDGETAITQNPVSHGYSEWGEFIITLSAFSDFCEDTTQRRITIEPPLPIADFDTLVDDCAPVTITLNNKSKYGVSFLWEFGDGATSSSEYPKYTYQFGGTYSIKLTVTGPGGETDVKEIVNAVTVRNQPTANFVYTPDEVSVPNPVVFINYSQFADSYEWDFGDSTTSFEQNPQKIYFRGGEYYPSLIALTQYGCSDTFQSAIPILVLQTGTIKVPNAFTPSTAGSSGGYYDPLAADNMIFFPVLTGVVSEDYALSVFNRWGELIFETHDIKQGWDGYYRGKICAQDAYVWKLKGEYVNGKKFSKVGDVTLIR